MELTSSIASGGIARPPASVGLTGDAGDDAMDLRLRGDAVFARLSGGERLGEVPLGEVPLAAGDVGGSRSGDDGALPARAPARAAWRETRCGKTVTMMRGISSVPEPPLLWSCDGWRGWNERRAGWIVGLIVSVDGTSMTSCQRRASWWSRRPMTCPGSNWTCDGPGRSWPA